MTVGDGSSWDETNPTNSTVATSIDDYDRDLRVGVRSRMSAEHEWPSSQSATNQAGQHKFITLQNQATKPTVSGTQLGAVYTKTNGSGLQELYWENEAGTEVQLTNRSSIKSSSIIGITSTAITSVMVVATSIPTDGTIPQITEGTSIGSIVYTPSATANYLKVQASGFAANSAADRFVYALFNSGTSNALVGKLNNPGAVNALMDMNLLWYFTPNTTGAQTFSVRCGINSGTAVINGNTGTSAIGSAGAFVFVVEEFNP